MALNIKSPDVSRMARELADRTGESITQAVATAVRERLEHVRRHDPISKAADKAAMADLWRRAHDVVRIDDTPDDEVLGYNEHGTWD